MGLLDGFLGTVDSSKRRAGLLMADALRDPQGFATQWGDQLAQDLPKAIQNPESYQFGGMAGVITKKARQEALDKLAAMLKGENVNPTIKGGLLTTPEQQSALNAKYSELTNGKQPPYNSNALDIAMQHIFDARVSGQEKPSGRVADSFPPNKVVDWLTTAGADSAKVGEVRGIPHLENVYTDPVTMQKYTVRIPISWSLS